MKESPIFLSSSGVTYFHVMSSFFFLPMKESPIFLSSSGVTCSLLWCISDIYGVSTHDWFLRTTDLITSISHLQPFFFHIRRSQRAQWIFSTSIFQRFSRLPIDKIRMSKISYEFLRFSDVKISTSNRRRNCTAWSLISFAIVGSFRYGLHRC